MTGKTVGLVPQVDLPILRELPEEGTNLGLKPMGATVRFLMQKHPEWELTREELTGRLKSMRHLGLAVEVVLFPVGKGMGWQRTRMGDELLAYHAELNGGKQ